MWKRDEAVRPPASGQPAAQPQPAAPAAGAGTPNRPESSQKTERDIVNIGKSVVIKGELNGSEDLTIEGQVEGTIQLRDHILTIGPNGKIKAQIFAKAVIVLGSVTGNVTANIAIRTGRKLKFDPVKEEFVGDEFANRYVNLPMRAPWHL